MRARRLPFAIIALLILCAPATAQTPQVTAAPHLVAPGGVVQIQLTGGLGNRTDWLGLYRTAESSPQAYLAWAYLNGTSTPPATGLTTATVAFTLPMIEDTYQVRYFINDTYHVLALSPDLVVQASTAAPASITLTVEQPLASGVYKFRLE